MSRSKTSRTEVKPMERRLIIEILLVPESQEKKRKEIEDEIRREFNEGHLIIPWSNKIEEVKIIEINDSS